MEDFEARGGGTHGVPGALQRPAGQQAGGRTSGWRRRGGGQAAMAAGATRRGPGPEREPRAAPGGSGRNSMPSSTGRGT